MNRNTVQGTRKCLEDSINSTVSCFCARVFVNCPIPWRLFQTLKLYLIFCYYILNLVKKDTELICTPIKYLLKLFRYQHNASVILLLPMEAVWIKILKKKKHFYWKIQEMNPRTIISVRLVFLEVLSVPIVIVWSRFIPVGTVFIFHQFQKRGVPVHFSRNSHIPL
jgi:hypothetical protein